MTSPRYAISPLAEADLEDIWLYTAQTWSVAQAVSYTNDIIDQCETLASGHKTGRPVSVRRGYHKHLVGRHVIFFQMREDTVVVMRILHQSMDVERHL